MVRSLRPAFVSLLLLTFITGVVYPLAVTVVAQLAFPYQANGSIIERDGRKLGSEVIGQSFDDPRYFWGRPSATGGVAYNALGGSGANQGPTNPALIDAIRERIAKLKAADPNNTSPIPVDLVTASGSGLDPDVSLAGALYQVKRVAKARGLDQEKVAELVRQASSPATFGVLGQARVNVLTLNLSLDAVR